MKDEVFHVIWTETGFTDDCALRHLEFDTEDQVSEFLQKGVIPPDCQDVEEFRFKHDDEEFAGIIDVNDLIIVQGCRLKAKPAEYKVCTKYEMAEED